MKKIFLLLISFFTALIIFAQSATLVQTLPITVYGGDAAWGDYDNDGDCDLAVIGLKGSTNPSAVILKNDNSIFKPMGIRLQGAAYGNIEWGDYDNDGDLDLLYCGTSISAGLTRLYKNNNGRFEKVNTSLPQLDYGYISFGDYDNDGDPDIALIGINTGTGAQIGAIYQNTNGTFTNINAGITPNLQGICKWGDADNDGDLDLLIVAKNESRIYINNGNNTFNPSAQTFPETAYSRANWFDYDNDGLNDIVMTGLLVNSLPFMAVWHNTGSVTFEESSQTFPIRGSEGVSYIDAADFDNDGFADFAQSGTDFTDFTPGAFYRSKGTGSFQSFQLITVYNDDPNESIFKFGDYDNDGDMDLITGKYIYRNDLINKPLSSGVLKSGQTAMPAEAEY